MSAVVIRGDARHLPLPADCVDLIVTSVPYWGQRDYQDGGKSMPHQIGQEPTWQEWLATMVDCVREWKRVLKPTGSMFINCGDKYTDKEMLGLPWRLLFACTDQLALINRRDIVWHKVNGLPESVTDRARSSHEFVFHLVRQPRYYAAVDEIREPAANPGKNYGPLRDPQISRGTSINGGHRPSLGPGADPVLGKFPGSVWSIPSQPLTVPPHLGVDHFAAFPVELPRRIVLGWSPPGVCVACGQGRRPVVAGGGYDPAALARRGNASERYSAHTQTGKPSPLLQVNLSGPEKDRYRIPHTVTGYVCACPTPDAPTRPALVVDPFMGTGTALLAADAYGRHAIGIDRSMDYARLARWRTSDPGERAKALGVPKPPKQLDGQGELFEELL